MLDVLFLGMHAIWPILLQPILLWKTTKMSNVAPPKDMEEEDIATPSPAPYRKISNISLEFVGITRAKLTSPNYLLAQSHPEQPETCQKK